MKNFFILKPEDGVIFGDKWAYADIVDPAIYGDAKRCPVCNKPVSMLEWLPPQKVKFSTDNINKWGDFVWGAGFTLLVSESFRQLYQTHSLDDSLAFSPQINNEISKLDSPNYYHLDIPWDGANLNDELSGLVWYKPQKELCEYCRIGNGPRRIEKIILDEDTWTGADMFIARGGLGGIIIVSEELKILIEKSNLRNCWLIPANKMRISTKGGETPWEVIDT